MSRSIRSLIVLAGAVAAVAVAHVATAPAAPCTACLPIPIPTPISTPISTTVTATRTLQVTAPPRAGVTSDPAGIKCGRLCTTSVDVTGDCPRACVFPGASTWTLSAEAPPAGFAATWDGCTSPTDTSCVASAGSSRLGEATATVTLTWTDVQAPTVTFIQPAKIGPSHDSVSATATDNSSSALSFDWTVDGAPSGVHDATLDLSGLAAGGHEIGVAATDGTNLSDAIVRKVLVDRSANVSVTAPPAFTSAATLPLAFTRDTDVVSTLCAVNGKSPVACSPGFSPIDASSKDGTYSTVVAVTDDVGNAKSAPAVSFVLDRTLPALAFTDGPAEGQQVVTPNVAMTFSQTELNPKSLACSLDGQGVPCSPGNAVALNGLSNGSHAFAVTAVDKALNARTITRTFGVAVPAPPAPPAPVTTPPPPPPPPSPAPPVATPFDPTIFSQFLFKGSKTTFTLLAIKRLPAAAKVTVTCKGRGCPLKRKAVAHGAGTLNLLSKVGRIVLRSGNVLQVRIEGDGGRSKTGRWQARSGRAPRFGVTCTSAGRGTPCN
ncbi:MAG: large repetitive protein [Solirubrobacteraceae bacterium]|nr:large repetitive protein [Solirubrobacteraceae bacterium]